MPAMIPAPRLKSVRPSHAVRRKPYLYLAPEGAPGPTAITGSVTRVTRDLLDGAEGMPAHWRQA